MSAELTGAEADGALLAGVELALERLEALPDLARQGAVDAVEAVVEVYAESLARVVGLLQERAPEIVAELVGDELIAHVLLLHGLHPESLDVRVSRALDAVRPHLQGSGGDVELLGIDAGTVTVRIMDSGPCCGSPAGALHQVVEDAISAAAPEVTAVRRAEPPRPSVPVTLVPRRRSPDLAPR